MVYTLPSEDMRHGHRMEGMTIDCKFKLWVALNGAGCILRIDPWKECEISRLSLGSSAVELCYHIVLMLIYCAIPFMLYILFSWLQMHPVLPPAASAGQRSMYCMLLL